jgi:hypothetical protein
MQLLESESSRRRLPLSSDKITGSFGKCPTERCGVDGAPQQDPQSSLRTRALVELELIRVFS